MDHESSDGRDERFDRWAVIDGLVRQAVCRQLRSLGQMDGLVQDIAQEVALHLLEDDRRRLRAFRGETDGKFAAFLGMIAGRYTLDYLTKARTATARETRGVAGHGVRVAGGSDDSELTTLLDDFLEGMDPEDAEFLRRVLDPRPDDPPVSARTRRRRMALIWEKYGHFFGPRLARLMRPDDDRAD